MPEDQSENEAGPFSRIGRALLRPGRGQVLVAVLLGLVGFAGVTQVRIYSSGDAYSGLPQADLVQAISGLAAARTHAEAELAQLQKTRSSLQDSTDQGAVALQHARDELRTLGILAGTTQATGPGLQIVVKDPAGSYRVDHLLDGIEELRDAGAEAIQINGVVRVVAQTSFASAPSGFLIDGHVVTQPYTIDVIGNPSTLKAALSFPGGFNDEVALDDATTTSTEVQSVKITALKSSGKPQYAQVTNTP